MNTFELKIWNDECKLCTFYTVQWTDVNQNETDKFLLKFKDYSGLELATQELLKFITIAIGNEHGAIDELFNRFENEVHALPVKGKVALGDLTYYFPHFPLRLFALRITEEIVVLFNGGIKDAETNQKSDHHLKWVEACQFAKKIIQAINNDEILIDELNRKLTDFNGEEDLIL